MIPRNSNLPTAPIRASTTGLIAALPLKGSAGERGLKDHVVGHVRQHGLQVLGLHQPVNEAVKAGQSYDCSYPMKRQANKASGL